MTRTVTKQVSFSIQLSQVTTYIWGRHTAIQLEDITVQESARVAPVRPRFSSVESDGENEGSGCQQTTRLTPATNSPPKAQASDDKVISSDMESDSLTAKQINAEVSR